MYPNSEMKGDYIPVCISPLPGPRAVRPVMKKLSRKAGLAPTVSSSSKASATVGRLTCRPGDMTVKSFAVTPSVCVVCHVRENRGRNSYDRPCRHRGATASISARLSLRPVRRGGIRLKWRRLQPGGPAGSVRSDIGLQLPHIRTSQRKVRNSVCIGPLSAPLFLMSLWCHGFRAPWCLSDGSDATVMLHNRW